MGPRPRQEAPGSANLTRTTPSSQAGRRRRLHPGGWRPQAPCSWCHFADTPFSSRRLALMVFIYKYISRNRTHFYTADVKIQVILKGEIYIYILFYIYHPNRLLTFICVGFFFFFFLEGETNCFLKLLKCSDLGGMIGFCLRKTDIRIRHKVHRPLIGRGSSE